MVGLHIVEWFYLAVFAGASYLAVETAPSFAISLCRRNNLNLSPVEAIRLGKRILMISNDPVIILSISFATSARVNTLLMISINDKESTTPVTVPLPP